MKYIVRWRSPAGIEGRSTGEHDREAAAAWAAAMNREWPGWRHWIEEVAT